jgi:hypothetical protein
MQGVVDQTSTKQLGASFRPFFLGTRLNGGQLGAPSHSLIAQQLTFCTVTSE